ncbi:MAG: type II toxin-antitoxin system RelE/ParE family toxin [Bryobacteraceae bacterium]
MLEIWNYIAEDSFDRADQVVARLYEAFTRLAQTPGVGHHRRGLADARYRFWTVYSYVIVYREANPLEVVAIVHGARHLDAFLQNRIADFPETDE